MVGNGPERYVWNSFTLVMNLRLCNKRGEPEQVEPLEKSGRYWLVLPKHGGVFWTSIAHFVLLMVLVAFSADGAEAPVLPKPALFKYPYRISKPNTNYAHCTTNCPPAKTRLHLEWDHYGPGSQFISFEVWGVKLLVETPRKLYVATNSFYEVPFKDGPQVFITGVYARDVALPQLSKNLLARQ